MKRLAANLSSRTSTGRHEFHEGGRQAGPRRTGVGRLWPTTAGVHLIKPPRTDTRGCRRTILGVLLANGALPAKNAVRSFCSLNGAHRTTSVDSRAMAGLDGLYSDNKRPSTNKTRKLSPAYDLSMGPALRYHYSKLARSLADKTGPAYNVLCDIGWRRRTSLVTSALQDRARPTPCLPERRADPGGRRGPAPLRAASRPTSERLGRILSPRTSGRIFRFAREATQLEPISLEADRAALWSASEAAIGEKWGSKLRRDRPSLGSRSKILTPSPLRPPADHEHWPNVGGGDNRDDIRRRPSGARSCGGGGACGTRGRTTSGPRPGPTATTTRRAASCAGAAARARGSTRRASPATATSRGPGPETRRGTGGRRRAVPDPRRLDVSPVGQRRRRVALRQVVGRGARLLIGQVRGGDEARVLAADARPASAGGIALRMAAIRPPRALVGGAIRRLARGLVAREAVEGSGARRARQERVGAGLAVAALHARDRDRALRRSRSRRRRGGTRFSAAARPATSASQRGSRLFVPSFARRQACLAACVDVDG